MNKIPRRRMVTLAHAHTSTQSYVFLRLGGAELSGSVHLPITDIVRILGLPDIGPDLMNSLEPHFDEVRQYVVRHLEFSTGTETHEIRFFDWRILPHGDSPYLVLEYDLPAADTSLRSLGVRYDAIIEAEPHLDALLAVQISRGWGALAAIKPEYHTFDSETPSHLLRVGPPSWVENLKATIGEAYSRVWRPVRRLGGKVIRASRRLLSSRATD